MEASCEGEFWNTLRKPLENEKISNIKQTSNTKKKH